MITVYIADDEMWGTLGLKKLLERSGYELKVVGTADNGLTAKEEIEKLKPDVVFADIRMPGLSGLELLEVIPNVSPDSKVVIITGFAEFSYAQTAVQLHAFDLLLKPIKELELSRVLKNAAGEKSEDPGEYTRMIDYVIADIREHYTEDISLTALAAKYNLSTGRLSTLIKERLSVTFSDYIVSLRMKKARELLRDDSKSIEQIAEMVGYNDYFYFTKVFKKYQGISPSKYRKNL